MVSITILCCNLTENIVSLMLEYNITNLMHTDTNFTCRSTLLDKSVSTLDTINIKRSDKRHSYKILQHVAAIFIMSSLLKSPSARRDVAIFINGPKLKPSGTDMESEFPSAANWKGRSKTEPE